MTRDEVYLEIKNDPTIRTLFALAMRRRDLWEIIRKNKWDADFMVSVFGLKVSARNTLRSMMKQWTSNEILRFYYKYHYPDWRGFRQATGINSGNFCPRAIKIIPDGFRNYPVFTKKQLLEKLNLNPLTIKNVYLALKKNPFTRQQLPRMSIYSHWNRFNNSDSDLMGTPRSDLIKMIIDQGIKNSDLSPQNLNVLKDKLITLYDYSHIVFDRPLSPEYYPFRTFEESKRFVRQMGFKTSYDFLEYRTLPEDVPANLKDAYPDDWKGWGDFLENGFIPYSQRTWRSFEEVKQYVRAIESIFTQEDWYTFCKANPLPNDIPITIHEVYKKEYKSWGDFIGRKKPSSKVWRPFKEVQEFAKSNNIRNKFEWYQFWRNNPKPSDIPSNPGDVYTEWKGWNHILGVKTQYKSYEEAQVFMEQNGIKTERQFRRECKNFPKDIPRSPEKHYKDQWKGFSSFLKNGFVPAKDRRYRSYEEAKKFALENKVSSYQMWVALSKSGNRPLDIPFRPDEIYESQWTSWDTFFGRDKSYREVGGRLYKWRPFEEVKKFARSLGIKSQRDWIRFCQSGQKPKDIPRTLRITYKREWKGWNDFLNKKK